MIARHQIWLFGLLLSLGAGGGCVAPSAHPSARQLQFASASLRWGAVHQAGSASRLTGVSFEVQPRADAPRCWSLELTVFDDVDGDGRVRAQEVLATRQALGARPGVTRFPRLRWSGQAVRPSLRVRYRDGASQERACVPIEPHAL